MVEMCERAGSGLIKSLTCKKVSVERADVGVYHTELRWTHRQEVDNASEPAGQDNSLFAMGNAKKELWRTMFGNLPEQVYTLRQYIMEQPDNELRHNTLLLVNAVYEKLRGPAP